ncbi:bacteriohemerythrin [Roseospira goensis]|uniref:Hemerythrin-like metal-binding protein n=1 Tax=Roseospira goensis TaxID=391922 RepID=A0A7W6WJ78_9PROT|nr:bacteriohemerythrin [Roseospira goensis]MBB4284911.1 hemerythrin-like metal-binding protein [Roseospira goensis]
MQKLASLFVVVEKRYQALQQDLRERDAQIRVLEEVNDSLVTALRALTARVQDNADALALDDTALADTIGRSESLVSDAFGTGGNANPTRPPDAGPTPEETDLAGAIVGEDEGPPQVAAGASSMLETLDGDELVFEEAPPEPALGFEADEAVDANTVALDPGPEAAEAEDTELALVPDQDLSTDDGRAPVGDAEPRADIDDEASEPLTWSETWTVGAEAMDRDHRILVNLVNALPQAFRAPDSEWVVGSVLNNLWDYTAFHFDREETLLRAANFPGAAEHAARHATLKEQIRTWLDRYQADPAAVDARELLSFLKGWLMNHILGEDMRYKPYVENNTDAQAIAAAVVADPHLLDRLGSTAEAIVPTDPDRP